MCDICTRVKKTFKCRFCQEGACADCIYTWVRGNPPTCMFCRKSWDMPDLQRMVSHKRFKIIRSEILLNAFKQKCQDDKLHIMGSIMMRNKSEKELESVYNEKRNLLNNLAKINEKIIQLKNRVEYPHLYRDTDLNGPCHYNQCNGHLNKENYCCICENYTCLDCKGVYQTNHECDRLEKASVSQIVQSCKECPVCKVQIAKVEGCDEMWCTQCKSSFDWKTLKIVKLTPRFHNPHYFEYNTNEYLFLLDEQLNKVTFANLRSVLKKNDKKFNYSQAFISNLLNIKKNCSEMIHVVNNLTLETNDDEDLKRAYLLGIVSEETISRILVRKNVSNSKKKFIVNVLIQYMTDASKLLTYISTNDTCLKHLDLTVTSLQNSFFRSANEYSLVFAPSYFRYGIDNYGRFFDKYENS
jgi:hypothetical protein